MHTENQILIYGPYEAIFKVASEIERWPEILPHYRWVNILETRGTTKVAEMAARRDGIPVKWISIQETNEVERWIRYRHIGGFTKDMEVEWTFQQEKEGVRVRIVHDFQLHWPIIGRPLSQYVVGEFFVRAIAGQTLAIIKQRIEGQSWSIAG